VVRSAESYSSGILGAQAAGIDQIWIHDGPTLTTETATYIVPRLADVLEIL
jgi:FMN phosphatase YigB (HAD superfamily)